MIAMPDLNNPLGGPHLIVTAKTANKVQFFDAATLAKTGEIDMPASTHEMILSPDGKKIFASIYGGGIFGKNTAPDRASASSISRRSRSNA
jgi:hypothetical protein